MGTQEGPKSNQSKASDQRRPEGAKAVSPGQRPGYTVSAANALQGQPMEQRKATGRRPEVGNEQCEHAQTLPSRDRGRQSQKNLHCKNAFALAGRTFVQRFNPGRCPGLTAFAPLGRFPDVS